MEVKKTNDVKPYQAILAILPYQPPFRFVDEFEEVTENGATGTYTYRDDEYFYAGHFPGNPVTPGVILIETMAQIGLVGLGLYLTGAAESGVVAPFAFTDSQVDFLKPVYPGERVTVRSEKVYFRFGKLRCKVEMINADEEIVCRGVLSGMILKPSKNG